MWTVANIQNHHQCWITTQHSHHLHPRPHRFDIAYYQWYCLAQLICFFVTFLYNIRGVLNSLTGMTIGSFCPWYPNRTDWWRRRGIFQIDPSSLVPSSDQDSVVAPLTWMDLEMVPQWCLHQLQTISSSRGYMPMQWGMKCTSVPGWCTVMVMFMDRERVR